MSSRHALVRSHKGIFGARIEPGRMKVSMRRSIRTGLALLASLPLAVPMASSASQGAFGWTKLDGRVRPPGASSPAMTYDGTRGEMVLLPGYDAHGGHGGTWLGRGRSWQRVFPGEEPERRYGAAMVHDEIRGEVVLFGGYGTNPEGGPAVALGDTWTWDGGRWHRREPPTSPSPRALAGIAYDEVRGEVVLFGGVGVADDGTPYSKLGDTWTWDGQTWTRHNLPVAPEPRVQAGMVFDRARGEVVLYGGSGEGAPNECTLRPMGICIDLDNEGGQPGDLGDTWVWDGSAWVQRSPAQAPPARAAMGMGYDDLRERVVLFSGVHVGGSYWDTWVWDGTTWSDVTPDEQPGPRFSPALAFDPGEGKVVMYGGHRFTYHASDTWGWDGTSWISLEEPTPPERIDATSAADPVGGGVLLFGGLGDGYHDDTWRYDGAWRRLSPVTSPPRRFDATMATDAEREEIVLFGGRTPGEDLGDTWVWTGSAWEDRTPMLPGLSPPERYEAATAFDEARGETVLFGGWSSRLGLGLSDTWTWDGQAWTPEVALGGPPALREHMMAYDAARQEVVLYGGIDDSNQVVGETWTWDGDRWTHENPVVSPGERAGGQMVYDPSAERVLLIGGLRAESPPHVWAWDGSTWRDLEIGPGPTRATWSTMASDPLQGGSVLFAAGDDAPDETWRLRLPPTG